ncbi:MAG: pyridoxamine 5'-phosphate oxidase family protein [candidate division KSB1 bacterium]|jgi:uncharacterized protein YhbP (UPF0306 family)|nr:pyridoxamine 5'-phosphate oxidase family protein [candidate division KSB1 bacterium]
MKNIDEPVFDLEFERNDIISSRDPELANRIMQLVNGQPFAVLCTQGESQPYASLIAYAFTEDLKHFFFTTPVATRKYHLLTHCERVALMIDNRCQHPDDMTKIEAITVTGKATHIHSGDMHQQGKDLLKLRHSYLRQFVEANSTALFKIEVVRYFHVTQFQGVSQWIP